MKQKYAVIILFALISVSGITSFSSYQATERMITEDMKSALTKTLAEQQSDVIQPDRTAFAVRQNAQLLQYSLCQIRDQPLYCGQ